MRSHSLVIKWNLESILLEKSGIELYSRKSYEHPTFTFYAWWCSYWWSVNGHFVVGLFPLGLVTILTTSMFVGLTTLKAET